jgi:hypothetical protein
MGEAIGVPGDGRVGELAVDILVGGEATVEGLYDVSDAGDVDAGSWRHERQHKR